MKNEISYIREFNRFYTNYIGVLDKNFLRSGFSLSETRVLYHIANSTQCTLKEMSDIFVMDKGYLSRIIKKLENSGLIIKVRSEADGRVQRLTLTREGRETVSKLNSSSDAQISGLTEGLTETERAELVRSMTTVQTLLSNGADVKPESIVIRTKLKTGDAGYITYMHGKIYGEDYGYSPAFEGYIAEVISGFLINYDPDRERLWCAEHNGKIIGSVAILDEGENAGLRWFLIDPLYRGAGLGKKLLNMAIDFAKEKGYRAVHLVTTSDLKQAMDMYKKAGFKKTSEIPNDQWHKGLMEVEFVKYLSE